MDLAVDGAVVLRSLLKYLLVAYLAFAVTPHTGGAAHAATITTTLIRGIDGLVTPAINFRGDILRGDFVRLRRLLDENPNTKVVLLTSNGGLVDTALAIGRLLREKGVSTTAVGNCASACALIWLAGRERFVVFGSDQSSGTRLCFHAAWKYDDAQNSVVSPKAIALIGAYVAELGYGPNVVLYVTTETPDDWTCLSFKDARLLGLQLNGLEDLSDLSRYLGIPTGKNTGKLVENAESNDQTADVDEKKFWYLALSSKDLKLLKTYLYLYPNGIHSDEAKSLIAELERQPDSDGKRWFLTGYKGLDFWGGDIKKRGVEAKTFEACAVACGNENACRLFTFNPAFKRCFLKDRLGFAVRTPNVFSGLIFDARVSAGSKPPPPVVVAEFQSYPAKVFTGFSFLHAKYQRQFNTVDTCIRGCRSEDSCSHVTFDPAKGEGRACRFWKSGVNGTRKRQRALSFKRINSRIAPTTNVIDLGEFQ